MFQPEKIDRFRLVRAEATEISAYIYISKSRKQSEGWSENSKSETPLQRAITYRRKCAMSSPVSNRAAPSHKWP